MGESEGLVNVIAYSCLHYGKDYLASAIRSVIDHVDEYHVLYSATGSHGHHTTTPCPETRDELYAIADSAAGGKLRWHDGTWAHEGYQRDSIHVYAPDADVILVVDADEIWSDGLALTAIGQYSEGLLIGCQRWRLPMIHYWRSFYRAVLHDPAYPERVIFPKASNEWGHASYINPSPDGKRRAIQHMGYAQRSEIIRYKLETHGHRGEFRRDVDWFNDVFMANRQHDCHVVGSEYWNPETVNPFEYGMPSFMIGHPYANMDVIP
jgi:hypothetical protein